jgi:dipeptidyl aminopeptidase/acylaminoacyl peptidase
MTRSCWLHVALAGCAAAHAPPVPTARLDASQVLALVDAHENVGGVLSPDGATLLFRSDRGGVEELYRADVADPDGPVTRLVAGPERVASAVFTRDGSAVIFRRDTGADNNFHILRARFDGGGGVEPVDLTPGEPMWRDSPLLPRARPDLMVYGARTTTDLRSMIVVQPLSGGEPRVVFRDSRPGTLLDVLPDSTAALWYREAPTGGHELLEVDLETGASRAISPRDGTAEMLTAGAYAADGARIYVATDHGTERHVVEAVDRASLAAVATYVQDAPATAEVASIVASPRGDRIAVMVDAGNHSVVRLLDAHTLAALGDVATPLGTAALGPISETRVRLGTGVFSDDGAHFAIDVSLPDAPEDIYLVDTATGRAAPLRHEPRPSLARLPKLAVSIAGVRAFDGLTIPVNVHVPVSAGDDRRVPTVLWLHGGPDANTPLEWGGWTSVLTAAGYAVLEPNIRGSTGFGRAYARADDRGRRFDALRDLESVNTWARAQPWCDPRRLVIAGGSFGGYYVLMALTHQPALWAAGIDLAGPSDLIALLGSGTRTGRYVQELGDPVADAAELAALSPIHAVDRVVAPLFVYQGNNDPNVPRAHADTIVAALRRRGIHTDYMLAGDEGHTVARRANEVELLVRMLRFLSDELPAAPARR